MQKQLISKSVVVIGGKEIELTVYAGNKTGTVEKAFEHLILSMAKEEFQSS